MQTKPAAHRLFAWIILLSALAFWPWTWQGFALPKTLILSAGLAVCFWLWALAKDPLKFGMRKAWPVWAYFGVTVFYTAFSITPLSSAGELLIRLLYAGVFILAMNVPAKTWARHLVWLNGLIAAYALPQLTGLDPLQFFWIEEAFLRRSFSFLGNPNWLASFIVLTLPVTLKQLKGKKWIAVFLVLNGLALFAAGSKAGFLAAGILAMLMTGGRLKKQKIWLAAICGLTIISLVWFYSDGWALTRSLDSRLEIWKAAWKALKAWPWGYGPETFHVTSSPFLTPELWQTEGLEVQIRSPHNVILEKWLEIGPWGLALFVAAILLPIRKAWKKGGRQKSLACGLIAYLATLLFGFETAGTGIVFWLFLGSLFHQGQPTDIGQVTKRSSTMQLSRAVTFALSCLFLLIFGLQFRHSWANALYHRGMSALSRQEPIAALNYFERAISVHPNDRIYLLQATELLLSAEGASERLLNQAQHHLNQLHHLTSGHDPDLPIFEAWLAAKKGEIEQFKLKLSEAFQTSPASARNYKISLHLYRQLEQEEDYQNLLTEFQAKLPDYWNQPETEAGRIFRKNHGWMEKLINSLPITQNIKP